MPNEPLRKCSARSSRAKRVFRAPVEVAERGNCFFLARIAIACSAVLLIAALLFNVAPAANEPPRPHIFGIAGVKIATSDIPVASTFYKTAVDPDRLCNWCEKVPPSTIALASGQGIKLDTLFPEDTGSRLTEIMFSAGDLDKLVRILKARAVDFKQEKTRGYLPRVYLHDPEGHLLSFIEEGWLIPLRMELPSREVFPRITHVGFVVRDRAAEDRFYKDLLGFHVYWHGGRNDDETDWVDMQVPDGTDWIEYMLNVSPSADKKELGVENHIALGVPDIHAAEAQLRKNGWQGDEKPHIGRDGKWQLNLYDPDDTRVELMEFTPVQKPCCSDYTGPHPKP